MPQQDIEQIYAERQRQDPGGVSIHQLKTGQFHTDKRVYEDWMEKEGIPIYEGFAAVEEDITELPRRPWARMGGSATFIELEGTRQGRKGCYVVEIPVGRALEPEKHLYDELIYIIRGKGLAEVWQEEGRVKRSFEWGQGSLFAVPLNAWHRLVNAGGEPVLAFAQTSAPLAMNAFRDTEFIFNCDYKFTTRYRGYRDRADNVTTDSYTGQSDYFVAKGVQPVKEGERRLFVTNFIPDVRSVFVDDPHARSEWTVKGARGIQVDMGGWSTMHIAEYPVGTYLHSGHFHGPSAVLLGLQGEGYALMWHAQYGIHPYQDGHGDQVVKCNWKENSIYCPPSEWFHLHLNTGRVPSRQLAATGGGLGIDLPTLEETLGRNAGVRTVVRGRRYPWFVTIPQEDEDPEIPRMFKEEIKKKGIEFRMAPVTHRT